MACSTLPPASPTPCSYLFEGDYNGSGEYFGRPDIIGNPKTKPVTRGWRLQPAELPPPLPRPAPGTRRELGGCVAPAPASRQRGPQRLQRAELRQLRLLAHQDDAADRKGDPGAGADLFNIFNHPNFSNPLLPGFSHRRLRHQQLRGRPAAAPRDTWWAAAPTARGFVQTVATPDVGSGNPFLGGGGPRTAQLAARFSF